MVIEWLLGVVEGLMGWLTDQMTWEGAQPRDVWGDIEGMVTQFASIGVWIDWYSIAVAVPIAVGVWLACFSVKVVRAVLAHVPAVGGAG